MKRALPLLLAAVCVVLTCFMVGGIKEAEAASNIAGGTCGNKIDWWLTTDGDMYFEGTGTMYYWDWTDDVPWAPYISQIKTVTVKSGVTEIGNCAFKGAVNLTEVSLPSSLTVIKGYAFDDCVSLSKINLPSKLVTIGSYAFRNTKSLKSVKFPSGLKTLGMCSFEGCGLTSVTVPAGLKTMDGYAFQNSDSLKTATIGVGEGSFAVGFMCFADCDNLTTVKMGNAVKGIESESFGDCPKLVNVTIGPNVTYLRSSFAGCTGLKEIVIPDKVTILNWGSSGFSGSFKNCTSLEKIVFGKSLEYIDKRSFEGCTAIKEIYFLGDAPEFQSTETFKGCTIKGYVPKDNDTWRPATLTNHGGYIDWNKVDMFKYATVSAKASNKASTGKIVVSWDKVDGAVKYEVYRATSKTGTYSRLTTTKSTSITNSSAEIGKTYYYKVRGVNDDGVKSKFSEIVSRTYDCARPVAKASILSGSGKPKVKWDKIEGASKYEVYRATSKNGTYSKILTTKNTYFTNTSATPGKTYYYKIRAVCSKTTAGNSAYSSVVSATCDCARPVVSISRNSSGKPKLSWKKVEGASKYVVYRATSKSGKYTKLGETTKTSYTNNSAKAGKTYYYKVKAICSRTSSGNSAYSAVKSIKAK